MTASGDPKTLSKQQGKENKKTHVPSLWWRGHCFEVRLAGGGLLLLSDSCCLMLAIVCRDTVDGRNPAPPKKPWNDDSPVNTNKQRFPLV